VPLFEAVDPIGDVACAPAQAAKADLTRLRHAVELHPPVYGRTALEARDCHYLLHRKQVAGLGYHESVSFCSGMGRKDCDGAQVIRTGLNR